MLPVIAAYAVLGILAVVVSLWLAYLRRQATSPTVILLLRILDFALQTDAIPLLYLVVSLWSWELQAMVWLVKLLVWLWHHSGLFSWLGLAWKRLSDLRLFWWSFCFLCCYIPTLTIQKFGVVYGLFQFCQAKVESAFVLVRCLKKMYGWWKKIHLTRKVMTWFVPLIVSTCTCLGYVMLFYHLLPTAFMGEEWFGVHIATSMFSSLIFTTRRRGRREMTEGDGGS